MQLAKQTAIYLAGFDVFREDAPEHGLRMVQQCRKAGFRAHFPLQTKIPSGLSRQDTARSIYQANIKLIESADIVAANINEFRGPGEPDAGTAFEIGYATGLRIPVWGYTSSWWTLYERVPSRPGLAGMVCDRGYLVENFDLPVNLMIACSATVVVGGLKDCLAAIRQKQTLD